MGCLAVLIFVFIYALVLGASYLLVAGLTFIVSLAFGFAWSWLLALGVWAVCMIIRWVLKAVSLSA